MSDNAPTFREYVKSKARSLRPTSLTLPDAFAYLEELADLAAAYAAVRANRATDNLCKASAQVRAEDLKEADQKFATLEARLTALEAKGDKA